MDTSAAVTEADVMRYLNQFTDHLAEEAAHYLDLHFVHGSPTAGNRTSMAGTIDVGTARFLDAHHGNYSYLFEKRNLSGQTTKLREYVESLLSYMATAKRIEVKDAKLILKNLSQQYAARFKDVQARLALRRLGLDEKAISSLSQNAIDDFGKASRKLYYQVGVKPVSAGEKQVLPAAYDVRSVFSKSIGAWKKSKNIESAEWKRVFKNGKSWASLPEPASTEAAADFKRAVERVMNKLAPSSRELDEWEARAARMNRNNRASPGKSFYYGEEKYAEDSPILKAIRGRKSFEEINRIAEDSIEALVDSPDERTRGSVSHLKDGDHCFLSVMGAMLN
jgi:hypothetical protein